MCARRKTRETSILTKFEALLDAIGKEQVLQKYFEDHPRLIPQEFVQNHGIHFSLILRKLKLAENYATDFFYLAKSSGDWNAVFVELENPNRGSSNRNRQMHFTAISTPP